MEVSYKSSKLKRLFEKQDQAVRKWGDQNARKLLQRHAELVAADDLEIFGMLPGSGFHRLTGRRKHQFACSGKHPFRLIFEADHDPVPRKEDGSIDLNKVTKIRIIEVVDYHGE